MTSFKVWYVLVPLCMFVEFVVGYLSFGCEPAKHMYVSQHAKAKKEVSTATVAGVLAFVCAAFVGYIFILESRNEMLDFAGNFVTFDDGFDRSIAAIIVTVGAAFVYGIALYAINRLGLSLHERIFQQNHPEPIEKEADRATSCSSVRYVESSPLLLCAEFDDDEDIDYSSASFDRVMRVFDESLARLNQIDCARRTQPDQRSQAVKERFYRAFDIAG